MAQLGDELGDVNPGPAVHLGRILPSHHRHPHGYDGSRRAALPQPCFEADRGYAKYLDRQPRRWLKTGEWLAAGRYRRIGLDHEGVATRAGHCPGRRGRQAAVSADGRPRQTGGSFRRRLPADRLRAVQSGERSVSADLRTDPIQVAFAGPPHLAELAALRACRRVHHAGARPAAARPALVHRLGRRDLSVAEPDLRRGSRLHRGVRRRPRVSHGPRADGPVPHRERCGRDGGRHPRTAGRGHRVRLHRRRRVRAASAASSRSRPTRRARPTIPSRPSRRWATTSSPRRC